MFSGTHASNEHTTKLKRRIARTLAGVLGAAYLGLLVLSMPGPLWAVVGGLFGVVVLARLIMWILDNA